LKKIGKTIGHFYTCWLGGNTGTNKAGEPSHTWGWAKFLWGKEEKLTQFKKGTIIVKATVLKSLEFCSALKGKVLLGAWTKSESQPVTRRAGWRIRGEGGEEEVVPSSA